MREAGTVGLGRRRLWVSIGHAHVDTFIAMCWSVVTNIGDGHCLRLPVYFRGPMFLLARVDRRGVGSTGCVFGGKLFLKCSTNIIKVKSFYYLMNSTDIIKLKSFYYLRNSTDIQPHSPHLTVLSKFCTYELDHCVAQQLKSFHSHKFNRHHQT